MDSRARAATVRVYGEGVRCVSCKKPMPANTPAHRVGAGWRHPACAPPPRRRKLARERGVVPSPIPARERTTGCGGCGLQFQRKELRYGYCPSCWSAEE